MSSLDGFEPELSDFDHEAMLGAYRALSPDTLVGPISDLGSAILALLVYGKTVQMYGRDYAAREFLRIGNMSNTEEAFRYAKMVLYIAGLDLDDFFAEAGILPPMQNPVEASLTGVSRNLKLLIDSFPASRDEIYEDALRY